MDHFYQPLRFENAEIRLLTLVPASNPEPLKCLLQTVSLPQAPQYVALSYNWGDPTDTVSIGINNDNARVRVNLNQALLRLRSEGVKYVWADALCINQGDNEEKSSQVRRMATIFQKASEVAVWLGPDYPLSEDAVQLLGVGRPPRLELQSRHLQLPVLEELLSRPYWRRVWIIQEIAVASHISVYCGRCKIPWDSFITTCQALLDGTMDRKEDGPPDDAVLRFTSLRKFQMDWLAGKPVRLMEALYRSQTSLSTDPRDKIYALLELTFDGKKFVPEPNYVRSAAESFTEFAIAILESGGPIDFIYLKSGSRRSDDGLPSWVPDWTNLDDAVARRQFKYIMDCILLPSADSNSQPTTGGAETGVLRTELMVKCVFLDTVNGLGSAFTTNEHDNDAHVTTMPDSSHSAGVVAKAPDLVYRTLAGKDLLPRNPSVLGHSSMGSCKDFHHLWNVDSAQMVSDPAFETIPKAALQSLRTWLDENRTFMFYGRTIESWSDSDVHNRTERLRDVYQLVGEHRGQFYGAIQSCMRLLVTENGHFGWAHPQAQKGDRIATVIGCSQLVILRAHQNGYQVVGDARLSDLRVEEFDSFHEGEIEQLRII